jgi:geranylgeranyl reductase family protein
MVTTDSDPRPFDVVVCGAGPAGAVAATVLAQGGARVAIVDKARFPRDKACGDLIGPRGVALAERLGLRVTPELVAGDMLVLGPTGSAVRLPARPGRTFPGEGWSVARRRLDAELVAGALDAGAEAFVERVERVERTSSGLRVHLADGRLLPAEAVVGADGAVSTVAASTGLLGPAPASWGFALRAYVAAKVDLPVIEIFDRRPGEAFPGYAWLFPGPSGRANIGVGLSTGSSRRAAGEVRHDLDLVLQRFRASGLLEDTRLLERPIGGWLRMGLSGTVPAADRVLLVGDAAGLVNPLQGEGIAQAFESGETAARFLLDSPAQAAARYRVWIERHFGSFQRPAATLQASLLAHPRALSRIARVLTSPLVGPRVAPAWGLYWNDLFRDAPGGPGARLATLADGAARLASRVLLPRR